VQHERQALRGREALEHHEEREPDRVREHGVALRVGRVVGLDDGLGEPGTGVILAPCLPGAERVKADPSDDGDQPGAQVIDRGVRAIETEPRLLHRIVGLRQRAQHPVRDRAQARPDTLELLRQPVSFHHSLVVDVSREPNVTVTRPAAGASPL